MVKTFYSVIAYLRTMAPIENMVAAAKSEFPVHFIIRAMGKADHSMVCPHAFNSLIYGKHVAKSATSIDVRTPATEKGSYSSSNSISGRMRSKTSYVMDIIDIFGIADLMPFYNCLLCKFNSASAVTGNRRLKSIILPQFTDGIIRLDWGHRILSYDINPGGLKLALPAANDGAFTETRMALRLSIPEFDFYSAGSQI